MNQIRLQTAVIYNEARVDVTKAFYGHYSYTVHNSIDDAENIWDLDLFYYLRNRDGVLSSQHR